MSLCEPHAQGQKNQNSGRGETSGGNYSRTGGWSGKFRNKPDSGLTLMKSEGHGARKEDRNRETNRPNGRSPWGRGKDAQVVPRIGGKGTKESQLITRPIATIYKKKRFPKEENVGGGNSPLVSN